MTIHSFLALGAILIAPVASASAQTLVSVNWGVGARATTGDADVSTSGTLVQAVNLGIFTEDFISVHTTETVVNGVTFLNRNVPSIASVEVGNFVLSESPGLLASSGNTEPYPAILPQLSSAYRRLLQSSATTQNQSESEGGGGGGNTMKLSMPNLVVGKAYEFQWWSNVPGAAYTEATGGLILSANTYYDQFPYSGVNGLGQFAIGTFTASDSTMYIEFNGHVTDLTPAGSTFPVLSAFQLRDISTVPEPSTFAFALGALSLATVFARRRSSAASPSLD